jgi:hypothetical protein
MESVGDEWCRRVERHNVVAYCSLINEGDDMVAWWCSLVKGRLLEFEVVVRMWSLGNEVSGSEV